MMVLLVGHGAFFSEPLAHDMRRLHRMVPRAVAGRCVVGFRVSSAFGGAFAVIPVYRGARHSGGSAVRPEMEPRGVRLYTSVNSISGEGRARDFSEIFVRQAQ